MDKISELIVQSLVNGWKRVYVDECQREIEISDDSDSYFSDEK